MDNLIIVFLYGFLFIAAAYQIRRLENIILVLQAENKNLNDQLLPLLSDNQRLADEIDYLRNKAS